MKHPSQYWTEYKKNEQGTLTPKQQRQIRKAFHAGISSALDFLVKLDGQSSKQIAEDLNWFHRHNQAIMKSINRC